MKRVNEILKNKLFNYYVSELNELEKHRVFCIHNIEHSLDVARIAYIYILENNLKFSKEVIYAVALLHDLGRVMQYKDGTDHHNGSVIIAEEIIRDIKFSKEEKNSILVAIRNHRSECDDELSKIIYKSDKLSRNCFKCKVQKECYWNDNKKNLSIKI